MPLYEYQCEACQHRLEVLQGISEPRLATCPECGGELKKQFSAPSFQFKGSGWYVTDYARKGNGADSEKAGKESAKEGGGKGDSAGKEGAGKSAGGATSSKNATKSDSKGGSAKAAKAAKAAAAAES